MSSFPVGKRYEDQMAMLQSTVCAVTLKRGRKTEATITACSYEQGKPIVMVKNLFSIGCCVHEKL